MSRISRRTIRAVYYSDQGRWYIRRRQVLPLKPKRLQLRLVGETRRLDVVCRDGQLRLRLSSLRERPWFLPGMTDESWQRIIAAVRDDTQDLSMTAWVTSDKFSDRRQAISPHLLVEVGDPIDVTLLIEGTAFDGALHDPTAGFREVKAKAGRIKLMTIEN